MPASPDGGSQTRATAGDQHRRPRTERGQTDAQLIVLAASVGKWMLPGTVSQYVLFKARCPVLLVPAHEAVDQDAGPVPRADEAGQHGSEPGASEAASQ